MARQEKIATNPREHTSPTRKRGTPIGALSCSFPLLALRASVAIFSRRAVLAHTIIAIGESVGQPYASDESETRYATAQKWDTPDLAKGAYSPVSDHHPTRTENRRPRERCTRFARAKLRSCPSRPRVRCTRRGQCADARYLGVPVPVLTNHWNDRHSCS